MLGGGDKNDEPKQRDEEIPEEKSNHALEENSEPKLSPVQDPIVIKYIQETKEGSPCDSEIMNTRMMRNGKYREDALIKFLKAIVENPESQILRSSITVEHRRQLCKLSHYKDDSMPELTNTSTEIYVF